MTCFAIDSDDVPTHTDVLMFDRLEGEWRIGHARHLIDGQPPYLCACTCAEASDLITDGEPVPVFAEVSHWAHLPDDPEG